MTKGKTWDKIKNAGKKTEALGRDVRDSVVDFFNRDDVKAKLKSVEDGFRSVRDKISDHFKEKPNKDEVNKVLGDMQKSIDDLKSSKPEDFDASANKILSSMKSVDSALTPAKVVENDTVTTSVAPTEANENTIVGDSDSTTIDL